MITLEPTKASNVFNVLSDSKFIGSIKEGADGVWQVLASRWSDWIQTSATTKDAAAKALKRLCEVDDNKDIFL